MDFNSLLLLWKNENFLRKNFHEISSQEIRTIKAVLNLISKKELIQDFLNKSNCQIRLQIGECSMEEINSLRYVLNQIESKLV